MLAVSRASQKVVVVGGGAAGYMAAIQSASLLRTNGITNDDCEILIFEATSKPLQKVSISGGGRCNVMHNPYVGEKIIANGYPRGSKELIGPYSKAFSPADTWDFFSSKVPLKIESDGRVFPETDQSASIIKVLKSEAELNHVSEVCGVNVKEIFHNKDDNYFSLTYTQKQDDNTKKTLSMKCDKLIVATGSSRIGYEMLKSIGHDIISPVPSLFSFKIQGKEFPELAGLSVPEALVSLNIPKTFIKENKGLVKPNNMQIFKQKGPVLFTHQGLSGPGVLKLSSFAARVLHKMDHKFQVTVSFIPQVSINEMIEHFTKIKYEYAKRQIGKVFPQIELVDDEEDWENYVYDSNVDNEDKIKGTIPRRLWNFLMTRANVEPTKIWAEVRKEEINRLATEVCGASFDVVGRGVYRDEFVTAGGVNLKEISFTSMQSKLVNGLFLAGECIDIDGITGGYNFQSAWTSGAIAGRACAQQILDDKVQ